MKGRWDRPLTGAELLTLLTVWAALFAVVVVAIRLFGDELGW